MSGGFEIVLLHEKFHRDGKVALDIYGSIYDRSHDKLGVMGGVASTSGGSAKEKLKACCAVWGRGEARHKAYF